MIRVEGNIYRTTPKYIILVLTSESKEKVHTSSSFFKVDTTKCRTEDKVLLNHGFIGEVSVLVEPRNYKFQTDKGEISGTRYIAKTMRRRHPF